MAQIHMLQKYTGVTLRLPNSRFVYERVGWLGQIIRMRFLKVALEMIKTVKEAKVRTTARGMKSFLGLRNAYHRFIVICTHILSYLNKMSRKDQPERLKQLGHEENVVFDIINQP